MDLNLVIQKHAQWKYKFISNLKLLELGETIEPMDVASISKDNCCEFGQWLYGEAKVAFKKFPAYDACLAAHTEFHREAGKVAKAINEKNSAEAERLIGHNTPFTETSKKVGVAIIELKNLMRA
jgi:methyl-accepting chemotaxis protein